ncbi:hypothetical protein FVEG_03219 [Fusarium verticillioides 7600]|uniref:Uncharacterized protein n=1 Tax=Gibberella moniliformis (strain M3125 / FGSC 7600) TaxID=334819 RepID=W7M0C7_GIBM7|nr:hypothetical protein FVEG_03219 [Fusarium verticillioides 7600]EWG41030.1 hypothetical protein FVEG_03219 [Fusarium verticillioides 7600]
MEHQLCLPVAASCELGCSPQAGPRKNPAASTVEHIDLSDDDDDVVIETSWSSITNGGACDCDAFFAANVKTWPAPQRKNRQSETSQNSRDSIGPLPLNFSIEAFSEVSARSRPLPSLERGGRDQVTRLEEFHVFKVNAKGWKKGDSTRLTTKDDTWVIVMLVKA